MTYREVVEALKSTTKKGVSLLIARYSVLDYISHPNM
jgi:hypothetical protein